MSEELAGMNSGSEAVETFDGAGQTGTPDYAEDASAGQEGPFTEALDEEETLKRAAAPPWAVSKGKAVVMLRSGASIEIETPTPRHTAEILTQRAAEGVLVAFVGDAVLKDADGSVIMRLASAQLTDAVMVGWTE